MRKTLTIWNPGMDEGGIFPGRLAHLSAGQIELLDALDAGSRPLYERDAAAAGEAHAVLVTGVPRSGTTLMTQQVARWFDVSYVSNMAAPFWRTPSVGLRFAAMVAGDGAVPPSLASQRGRTVEPTNVHEFGYFWSWIFGMPTMREAEARHPARWGELSRAIAAMTTVGERPVVLKSFHVALNLREAVRTLPSSIIVVMDRDVRSCADSLHRAKASGGLDELGLVTRDQHHDASELDQILALQGRIDRAARLMNSQEAQRLLVVEHDDLVHDPARVMVNLAEECDRRMPWRLQPRTLAP